MRIKITAAVLALCMVVLSGCSFSFGTQETEEPTSPPVEQEQAQTKNILTVAVYEFDTFQPLATASQSVRNGMRLVYEPLFEVGLNGKSEPVLATGYELSADGLTVTVGIKSGVTFHDGSALTARDVVYSTNMAAENAFYSKNLEAVRSCTVSGDRVIFKLTRPVPDFGSLLTYPIVKNNTPAKAERSYVPIGTGPYYYGSKKTVDSIAFYRYEGWHKTLPQIEEVDIYTVQRREDALNMFDTGRADVITSGEADTEYTIKGNVKISDYASNKLVYLGFNLARPYFWSRVTRQALAEAVNKRDIVSSVIYGQGYDVDYAINPDSVYAFDTEQSTAGNMDYAMELLESDGWELGNSGWSRNSQERRESLSFKILVNSESPQDVSIAEYIAEAYATIGIKAEVDAKNAAEYTSSLESGNFDIFIGETDLTENQDPYKLVYSGQNLFSYSNPEMDAIVSAMGTTVDEATLNRLFMQYGQLVYEDVPFIPLFYRRATVMYSGKVNTSTNPTLTNPVYGIEGWTIG